MALKTSELNAKLFGKTNKRRVVTPQEAQTAAKEKAQTIELAVAGENIVQFELVRIPANKVATETTVFVDNAREQSFLNEHALSDVLVTLKERGQQYPAVGRRTEDGKIEVLDGSRRRMSCILAEQDFWFMLLTTSILTMLSFCLMWQMLTNRSLYTKKVKRCRLSLIVVKLRIRKHWQKCSSAVKRW